MSLFPLRWITLGVEYRENSYLAFVNDEKDCVRKAMNKATTD